MPRTHAFSRNEKRWPFGLLKRFDKPTLDFLSGASQLEFANSSSLSWSGILNLANWEPSIDRLRIGTDATGLTSAQLAIIEFNGGSRGTAQIDSNGFVVVPEPSTAILLAVGGPGMVIRRRRTA